MRPRLAIAAMVVVSLSVAAITTTSSGAVAVPLRAPAAATGGVSYTYDAVGRLASVTSPAGITARYTYDAVGNLLGTTQATAANAARDPSAAAPSSAEPAPAAPVVAAVRQEMVDRRDSLVITGRALPTDAATARVKVGRLFTTIRSMSAKRLVADVPPQTPAGRTDVTVTGIGGSARGRVNLHPASPPTADPPSADPADTHPLMAPPGVTAVAGQIKDAGGRPLAGVALTFEGVSTRSRSDGRFLIAGVPAGHGELLIDATSSARGDYGRYEEGVDVNAGKTAVLPWTTWLTTIDNEHSVALPAQIEREIVVTTPAIPGLEVHVPPGTRIVDRDGHPVSRLSITKLPLDRQPFPGAPGMPLAWTIQPGGATVSGAGLAVVYPNITHQRPGTRIDYVDHDGARPGQGWAVYGHGYVAPTGQQVIPDASTRLHETYLLGVSYGVLCQYLGINCPRVGDDTSDGDPVDLQTGLFGMSRTDLGLTDVIPVALTRSYRQNDPAIRSFGMGQSDDFNLFVAPDSLGRYVVQMPDGRSVPFTPGADGSYTAVPTPTSFLGAIMTTDQHTNFVVKLADGQVLTFGGHQASLVSKADRYGNATTMQRDSSGRVVQVTSPNGRWIALTWGACTSGVECIAKATDNLGRTVSYGYDASGRLVTMTNPAGKVTTYGWATCADSITCTEMTSVTDPLAVAFVRNEFDAAGRVSRQTQPDGGAYTFAYALDAAGKVTSTTATDPRGAKRTVTYNADGYPISDTAAFATSVQQTTTYTRAAGTNLVTAVTDARSRKTSFTYDANGNVLTVTRLAGTANALIDTFTYEPAFGRMVTATDPLGGVQRFAYDDVNNVVDATDPLGHTTRTLLSEGQPVSVTDAVGAKITMSYLDGDLVAVTNPLGKAATAYYDAAGRVVRRTDPLKNVTRFQYGTLDELLAATDALGRVSRATYDADGNRLTSTDALGHTTSYAYDVSSRLRTRTDALGKTQQFSYDLNGNLVASVDRNGVKSTASYDLLGRPVFAGFKAVTSGSTTTYESTASNTYDTGNRLTAVADTASGNLTRGYDEFDRLTAETTPRGTVSYIYDKAGRRTAMTVAGQPQTAYTYDLANRLTGISGGTGAVAIIYDNADRRTSVTSPGGVKQAYTYDAASQLTGITQTSGAATLGTLTYGYDAAGRRTSVGGTLARSALPAPGTARTYNAVNELTSVGATTLTYDGEGQLLNDGTRTYTWNARHQLAGVGGTPSATFSYDPSGRRASKTVGGVSTSFVYDGPNVVQEKAGATPSANLLTGLSVDETFVRSDAAGARSVLTDALGSTVALTDGAGAVSTSYTYDPHGVTTSTGAASSNSFAFAGREQDGTGLYFNRARYYSPTLQRFISQDPLGESGSGANLYEYAGGSPTNYDDPSGQFLPLVMACLGGAAFDVGAGLIGAGLSGRKYTWADAGRDAAMGCVSNLLMGAVGKLAMKGLEAVKAAKAARAAEGATTKVFRVEGPGNARLDIGGSGNVSIKGDNMLFLNFGDEARAQAFLAQRLAQGHEGTVIKSFDVPTSYVNALRARAVPEGMARQPGASVISVDTTKTTSSFGLRSSELPGLRCAIIPGSGC